MFEKISGKLSKITKNVTDSTQQQLDVMKINLYIKREEAIIESAYKEIGKLYFNQNAPEKQEEYVEYIDTVREAKTKISEWKEKIAHMKGILFCNTCNQKIKGNMYFCPNCGTKISKLQEADTDNKEIQEDLGKKEIIFE